jgi:thiamine-phosphate pyrophosphorylase
MKRIIDANLNRATEATRILEEIARFLLDDKDLSQQLKDIRHKINLVQEKDYENCLKSRNTQDDVGVDMENSTHRNDIENIFKANIKRLQQALRTLSEYSFEDNKSSELFEKLRYKSYTLEQIMWERLKEKYNKLKLSDKKLYLVTNSDKFETQDEFLNAVALALKGGIDILQLREKNLCTKDFVELAKKVKQLCDLYDVIFIVNDRVDIAMLAEADGIHVGQDDMKISDVRKLVGENMIIGKSTHAIEQAQGAIEEGVDYIGVGPVFETPTKKGRKAVGLEYVKWVSENIKIPAFAIGGIDLTNCEDVLNNGIGRIAVVRAIINSENPQKSAEEFLKKIKK